jgi:hypothetical protein
MPHFREEVKNQLAAVHVETELLRSKILGMAKIVPSSGPRIYSPDRKYVLHWKFGHFQRLRSDDDDEYEISAEHRSIRCAILDMGNDRVASVDFNEYKLLKTLSDKSFLRSFDECSLNPVAAAFLSGWESKLLAFGNFAHLDHIAAKKGVGVGAWGPLVTRFIDEMILKSSFVVLGNPYPFDVVATLHKTIRERLKSADGPDDPHLIKEPAMEAFARRRHEAKWKFFSNHLGFTKYPERAATPGWMYKLRGGDNAMFNPVFRPYSKLPF